MQCDAFLNLPSSDHLPYCKWRLQVTKLSELRQQTTAKVVSSKRENEGISYGNFD